MKTNHARGFSARADRKVGYRMIHKAGFKAEGVRGLRRAIGVIVMLSKLESN